MAYILRILNTYRDNKEQNITKKQEKTYEFETDVSEEKLMWETTVG